MKLASKLIGCSIHGHIRVSHLALKIIDTEEFQRLRNIKQLGLCNYIYPAATHTRFEHSIGVYHLAGKVVEKLQKDYPNYVYDIPYIGKTILTNFIGELIKIAGLCHDIGHGPYSHLFDDIMERITGHENSHHEVRSCLIIDKICRKYLSADLTESHIKFIQSVVNPDDTHKGAIYQIVANNLNGIDVDKFDYLARDSKVLGLNKGFDPRKLIDEMVLDTNGNIAYAKHCSIDIYDMFQTRYMMHKIVYNHKTTKIIEEMIRDVLEKIEPIFHISDFIYDMDKFCELTDHYIPYLLKFNPDKSDIVKSALSLYQNIVERKLYKCITDEPDINRLNEFIDNLNKKGTNTENLIIVSTKIGFVSGNKKNPFDTIFFYDKKELMLDINILAKSTDDQPMSNSFILDKNQISVMLSSEYTESHNFLICKDKV